MSCCQGLKLRRGDFNREPSAFESPATVARGELRTAHPRWGWGHAFFSHQRCGSRRPCAPRGGAPVLPLSVSTGRARERARATGWKNKELSPWWWPCRADPVSLLAWELRSSRAWGPGRQPLKPDTQPSRKGNFAGWWVGEAGLLLLEYVPTHSGHSRRLALEKEVRRGQQRQARRGEASPAACVSVSEPQLQPKSCSEPPLRAGGIRGLAGCLLVLAFQTAGWDKKLGTGRAISFHWYLKQPPNNNNDHDNKMLRVSFKQK